MRSGGVVLAALVLVACGDDLGDGWRRVEGGLFEGVNFRDSWGTGDDVWAVGRTDDIPATIVVRHGADGWSRVEGSVTLPDASSIWSSGEDDVWLAGQSLWRWDGADWGRSILPRHWEAGLPRFRSCGELGLETYG